MSDPRMYPQGRSSTAFNPSLIGEVQSVDTPVSDSQLKSIKATPIELTPLPGLGRCVELISAIVRLNAAAGAYGGTTTSISIRYGTTSIVLSGNLGNEGFFDQAALKFAVLLPLIFISAPYHTNGDVENAPLVLWDSGPPGEMTGGHVANRMRITTACRVWPATW